MTHQKFANLMIAAALASMESGDSRSLDMQIKDEEDRQADRRRAAREGIALREAQEKRRKEEYEARAAPYRQERERKKREAWLKQHPEAK